MDAEARLVADLGNTRLKWGLVGPDRQLLRVAALAVDDPATWAATLRDWVPPDLPTSWAIATVNPPTAARLGSFLESHGARAIQWYRSAADVPVRHQLDHPAGTGADRALAVAQAVRRHPAGRPGQVVSCGTAITIEAVDERGIWLGGAITSGLMMLSRGLHAHTAQLPMIDPLTLQDPPPLGGSTIPALRAGVYWGAVGAVREVLTRQIDPSRAPWLVWTGGDAAKLAPALARPDAEIVPDLVLQALAHLGFGTAP